MSYKFGADSPQIRRAVDLVTTSPGITIHEIAARMGLSLSHTKNIMSASSRFNLCMPAQDCGRRALWFAPHLARQYIAQRVAGLAERRRAQERERVRRDRMSVSRGQCADPHQWRELSDVPERRTVAANDVPMPFTRAVNSVFALGAAA